MPDLSPGVSTPEQITERLAVLRRKRAARVGRDGQALPNYRENVAEIDGEIARLEGMQDG